MILVAIVAFYITNPRSVVGDALVNTANGTPMEFPPPSISRYYVKPVTIMFVAGVVFSFCFFSLVSRSLTRVPRSVRALLMLLSIAVLAVSSYETLFNFAIWGSSLVTHADPDTVVNSYPINSVKVNLVFATKSFVALLFVSYFSLMTFRNSLERENI